MTGMAEHPEQQGQPENTDVDVRLSETRNTETRNTNRDQILQDETTAAESASDRATYSLYPDYDFTIERRQLSGEIYDITPSERLRVAARSLAGQVPEFQGLARQSERQKIFEQHTSSMKQRVAVQADGKKRTFTRSQLTDMPTAVDKTLAVMWEINHPTTQLLDYINDTFGDKTEPHQFNKLRRDLVVLTAQPILESILDIQAGERQAIEAQRIHTEAEARKAARSAQKEVASKQ